MEDCPAALLEFGAGFGGYGLLHSGVSMSQEDCHESYGQVIRNATEHEI